MPRLNKKRRICIIGAGGVGSCLALELASRGYPVTLLEKNSAAITESSFYNEGKIHLGYIYAKDSSFATAALMIDGALEFATTLKRWISLDVESIISSPFYYGVHRGSLMTTEALRGHYDSCEAIYNERSAMKGLDYLDLGIGSHTRQLRDSEIPSGLNREFLGSVFETTEHAVDPRPIAAALSEELDREPRISLNVNSTVTAITPQREGFRVIFYRDGRAEEEKFTDVVNATWYARLPLDRPLGIQPPGPWSHRYKLGNRILVSASENVPSLTMVQGPFGDVVNFGDSGYYLSWYPTGRRGMSTDDVPPDWHGSYSREQRLDVFHQSYREMATRCRALDEISFSDEQVDPGGCVIYALGTEDVDKQETRLHERVEIGIQSRGRYHSIDTGKYTLVPYWALRAADRVLGTT